MPVVTYPVVEFYREPEMEVNQVVLEVIRVESEGELGFPEYIKRRQSPGNE